ncbi:MAG: hypothetical protein NW226_14055 [Microscillaceae bacterium]|nr:hypothetical protein [Microscillaceae bacterium]
MNSEKYTYLTNQNNLIYTFLSIGIQGVILKVVIFEKIDESLYNLAFGDFNEKTQEIDDKAVSNNGDTIKVLATVIQTIRDFYTTNVNASVIIKGSSSARTRLYQKIIRDNIATIQTEFEILALNEQDEYEIFYVNGKYEEFKIKKI